MSARVAYLAPEIPSVSATFVFREIAALRAQETEVVPFSLHRVAPDALSPEARAFLPGTTIVYERPLALLAGAFATIIRHPIASARAAAWALRDLARGRFARAGQRAKVIPQLVAGLRLSGLLREARVQHLHVHFAHAPATVGMYAARAAGIPFSVTAHANDIYVEGSLLAEKVARSRSFVTISEVNRAFLERTLGPVARRVALVRCGVDAKAFAPGDAAPAGPPTILSVGRLVPKKGFDLLLEAVAALRSEKPRVVIAGDGPERARLEEHARTLGIADRVRFLGAVGRDEIVRALAEASVFVLACRVDATGDRDGIPVALMEAMASGVAVVSTSLSGIPELVEDGVSGRLVAPGDADALALALEDVLADPAARARLAASGRARVAAEFDLGLNAGLLRSLLLAPSRNENVSSRENKDLRTSAAWPAAC